MEVCHGLSLVGILCLLGFLVLYMGGNYVIALISHRRLEDTLERDSKGRRLWKALRNNGNR